MAQQEVIKLPKGWIGGTASDLVLNPKNDIVDGPFGSNLKASEYTDSGTPIVRIQNVKRFRFVDKNIHFVTDEKAEQLKRHSFKGGDVLITKLGEPLGLACIAPGKYEFGIIVADIVRARPYVEISNKFMTYLLNSRVAIEQISKHTKGSTRARINLSVVRNLNIPIPPLAEQKRIVEKLDSLLAQVDIIQKRLNNLPDIIKRFRQSVLAAAVSGKLTEQWREENKVDEWKSLTIGDISTFQNGFAFKSGWFTDSGKFQVIKLGNVKDDYLKLEKSPAFVSSDIANEYMKYKPDVGDILITMTGTKYKGDYGYACRVNEDLSILINQRVGRIIAKSDLIDSKFLLHYMRSELFRIEFLKGETGGVNQGNVGTKHIQSCPIGIPSSNEQTEIVRLIEQYFALADTLEKNLANAKQRVDNLTQSILAKAFKGELVPQDESDEPADKLLERIKAAREEAEKLEKAEKKAAKSSKASKTTKAKNK